MKTIIIQLMKTMALSEDEYSRIRYFGYAMEDYAPYGVYDYFKLGGSTIIATLNPDLLTNDLVPMIKEFYSVYGDKKYSQQYDTVLQEFNKFDSVSFEICENLSYEKEDIFYPVFINDANTKPFLMYEQGIKADCTGIILCTIPPEKATFSMLYTKEQEMQNKLSKHPLAKALKVCMMLEP